jgi:hypothetical protein
MKALPDGLAGGILAPNICDLIHATAIVTPDSKMGYHTRQKRRGFSADIFVVAITPGSNEQQMKDKPRA